MLWRSAEIGAAGCGEWGLSRLTVETRWFDLAKLLFDGLADAGRLFAQTAKLAERFTWQPARRLDTAAVRCNCGQWAG
jgi:hypothetical protein